MQDQGRELRPTENSRNPEARAYSLEAIMALQKALEAGIPEQFLVTISDDIASPTTLPGLSTPASQQFIAPSVSAHVPRRALKGFFAVVRHPCDLLARMRKSFARHRRSAQRSA